MMAGCSSPSLPDGPFGSPLNAKSTNLEEDLKIMWSVERPDPQSGLTRSTTEAVGAAYRVFNTIDLVGMTRFQVAKKLRFDLRATSYGYQFPFYPVEKNVLPVRIDNGNYGWQYNIIFNAKQRVERVKPIGIE